MSTPTFCILSPRYDIVWTRLCKGGKPRRIRGRKNKIVRDLWTCIEIVAGHDAGESRWFCADRRLRHNQNLRLPFLLCQCFQGRGFVSILHLQIICHGLIFAGFFCANGRGHLLIRLAIDVKTLETCRIVIFRRWCRCIVGRRALVFLLSAFGSQSS